MTFLPKCVPAVSSSLSLDVGEGISNGRVIKRGLLCVTPGQKKGNLTFRRESIQLEMSRFKPSLFWLCPQFICSSFRGIAAQKNVSHKKTKSNKKDKPSKTIFGFSFQSLNDFFSVVMCTTDDLSLFVCSLCYYSCF